MTANHVRITASAGDGLYSIGEAEFFASPRVAALPEPSSWAMMVVGLGMAGSVVRRRRATVAIA